ncbi:hypothetical protein DF3PB_140019 [uncultured Defluviicoccus sp.]|uniref:PNPLA domain-containing protein n=1 Tax=metagenome TaxID=256318 RepID=A0A380T9M8_9ZZZZ|nr:hypothetical protein DF3PB_140019 [uncultured Defluviicoccus sp.]
MTETRQTRKIAIPCQGGGTHGAFEGVLTQLLEHMTKDDRVELVRLSGTSAGALCANMVWYGWRRSRAGPAANRSPMPLRQSTASGTASPP